MDELLANVPKLVVPDAGSLIAGSQATPELMAFLNEIARFANITRGLDVPAVADITPDQLADDFGVVVLKRESTSSNAPASTSSAIPLDNTAPQSSEGEEYQTLSFTPTRSDSKILIKWTGAASHSLNIGTIAIFRSDDTSAIIAAPTIGNWFHLRLELDSWGTDPLTISMRYGAFGGGGTLAHVGRISGNDYYNGRLIQTLTVTEFKATPIPA
jgi:hypothetical protein